MNNQTPKLWWTRTVTAVRADPRKTLFLAVLVVVLGVALVRAMSGGGDSPQKASASAIAAKSDAPGVAATHRGTGADALRKWLAAPIAPLERDLFKVKLDYFPQDGTQIAKTLRPPSGDGFWDRLAKSMTVKADQVKERQILLENLRLQAAQLKLQTTLMGRHPRAMVNGELVGEGDVVASFRVLAIEARRIIVEREGVKLEILMN